MLRNYCDKLSPTQEADVRRISWGCLLALGLLPSVAYSQALTATPSPVTLFLNGPNNATTPRSCSEQICIATQTVTTNRTISSFAFSEGNATSVNWLTVTSLSPTSLQVKVDMTNLKDGYYAGRLLVSASGANNSPVVVRIHLSIFPADGYSSPETQALVGGANANSISIANLNKPGFQVNAAVLPLSPVTDGSWLVITPVNPIPASGTSAKVNITVNPSVLNGSTGSAFVTFTDATTNNAATYTLVTYTPPQVTVPNVVGLTQAAATTAIQNAGLSVGAVTTQSSATLPAGRVIGQNPGAASQLPQGSSVSLVVSSGQPAVTVPNVVGLPQSAATAAIQNAGLAIGPIATQASASVAAGIVISQAPAAGAQITPASAVSLIVSSGPDSTTPTIRSPGGVLSATGFGGFSAIAPGTWIEIYGTNLASNTRLWAGADFRGNTAPTALDGTSVAINGQAAAVLYISPVQVNAQVPFAVSPGLALVTVTNGSRSIAAATVPVNATESGLLELAVGPQKYAVGILPDLTYALPPGAIKGLPSRQAKPGETVVLYGIGFGPAVGLADQNPLPSGQVVTQANRLSAPFTVSFGSTPATVSYAGLAPSYVGLYQFNVVVPAVPDSDTVPLRFSLNGAAGTQTLFIAVHR
jgi:uncharacterized protein (TIGR03437 family)